MQTEITVKGDYRILDPVFAKVRSLFLVCDRFAPSLPIARYVFSLRGKGITVVPFSDFEPNPDSSSVRKGIELFRSNRCDTIAVIGGGSAIDVAKCIKRYAGADLCEGFIRQPGTPNDIPLIAAPTTAGTGSEATRFAVVYYHGEKQSVTDEGFIPSVVIFDPSVLDTLPAYQRKATMLDALCHTLESYWSIHSTDQSKEYAGQAIALITENIDPYLENLPEGNRNMLKAANLAGKAINITQTTAGHALCYKLTGLYGMAHGHAAALCVNVLLPYMIAHTDDCVDGRGKDYLQKTFDELAKRMRCDSPAALCDRWTGLLLRLDLPEPDFKEEDLTVLTKAVNPDRLKNNPVALSAEAIEGLYRAVFKGQAGNA